MSDRPQRHVRRITSAPSVREDKAVADALFIRQAWLLDGVRDALRTAERRARQAVESAEGVPASFTDLLLAIENATYEHGLAVTDLNEATALEES
jgi:hypothetical protein